MFAHRDIRKTERLDLRSGASNPQSRCGDTVVVDVVPDHLDAFGATKHLMLLARRQLAVVVLTVAKRQLVAL